MRYAVLGAAGQLGNDLVARLSALGEVLPLSRAQLELGVPGSATRFLTAHPVDYFINCAAYNFVDRAETDQEACRRVNAIGVGDLALACAIAKVRLVHFSTDYVFGENETRNTPYTEEDQPGPISEYGRSKLQGEELVRSRLPESLMIRTCGLYGIHGSGGKGGNFVETMLRLAANEKPIRVVNDQRCTPSYTVDIADAAVKLITANAAGLYHATNSGDCTWYEFAAEIFRQAGLKPGVSPITSSEYGAVAKRPAYSVLSNQKLVERVGSPLRHWKDALAAYLTQRQTRSPNAASQA